MKLWEEKVLEKLGVPLPRPPKMTGFHTRGRPSTNWVQVPALPLHSHSPWASHLVGQSTRIHAYVEKGQLGLLGGREEVLVRAGICRYSERPAHLWALPLVETFSIQSYAVAPSPTLFTSLGEQCVREGKHLINLIVNCRLTKMNRIFGGIM